MKLIKSVASDYYKRTVSGNLKYTVAPGFAASIRVLNENAQNGQKHEADRPNIPSHYAFRKHPCSLSLPALTIPGQLDRAAVDYLRENSLYSPSHLKQFSKILNNHIWARSLITRDSLMIDKKKQIERPDKNRDEIVLENEDLNKNKDYVDEVLKHYDEQSTFSSSSREQEQHLKAKLQAEHSLTYNKENSILYLVARLSPNFAIACRVLYEIRKRCPLFVPKTLFDFASGLGTHVWAVNTVWPIGCVREHYLVDASASMTSLSEFLLQRRGKGFSHSDTLFPGIHHRRFMPSTEVSGELVMSGHSLVEIPDEVERRRIVENLWDRTTSFLVLIEQGTKAGFAAILEARNWLIRKKCEDMHIFAPCPHVFSCGKEGAVCNFRSSFYQFGITEDPDRHSEELFSYLIVSKGDWHRFEAGKNFTSEKPLPRIISTQLEVANSLNVDLCLPDGEIERVAFSKSRIESELYHFLRNTKHGDIAPCQRKLLKEDTEFEDPNTGKRLLTSS